MITHRKANWKTLGASMNGTKSLKRMKWAHWMWREDKKNSAMHGPGVFSSLSKRTVWGVHSVGMANLPDRNSQMHGRTYGFIGNMYQVDDGIWAIPGMTEINPAEMFCTVDK